MPKIKKNEELLSNVKLKQEHFLQHRLHQIDKNSQKSSKQSTGVKIDHAGQSI